MGLLSRIKKMFDFGHNGADATTSAKTDRSTSQATRAIGPRHKRFIEEKIAEVSSNLPGKAEFDEQKDLNAFDVDGLLAALESGDRTRKLIALEKLAWPLYGRQSSRVETALVGALRDPDKFVAIRAAKTLLMEGGPGDRERYREHVVEACEDSSIAEDIRVGFLAMIKMTDRL